jgi:hypothetical protein
LIAELEADADRMAGHARALFDRFLERVVDAGAATSGRGAVRPL